MGDSDFNELSGRIDGLARAFLVMTTTLQRHGALDEQLLQARLRVHADELPPGLETARSTLTGLADQLLRDFFLQKGKTEADLQAALKEGSGPEAAAVRQG